MQLARKLPMRGTMAAAGVAAFVVTLIATTFGKMTDEQVRQAWDGFQALLMLLGVGIGGDTWRPSGQAIAANRITSSTSTAVVGVVTPSTSGGAE